MGSCCSCHCGGKFHGFIVDDNDEEERDRFEENINDNYNKNNILTIRRGDNSGARIRLQGSSKYVSMFTQQGRKGVNQDAMTVWENFSGDKDMFLCAVFDGHGSSGHKVASYIRDLLPIKISTSYKQSNIDGKLNTVLDIKDNAHAQSEKCESENPLFLSWKARLIKCFEETDEELEADASIESYCSGTTSICVLKKGEHLIIANLGDSRAVLCKRDEDNALVSEQLTVDLKPNLPEESERIRSCQGRVMAMDEEQNVYRVWMPDEDCPGLAMARAFGDFCLKDFGLISTPEVSYRKLTDRDEFVVLATDGIWDALSNDEVVSIVASARKRSLAAKSLVEKAVRTWRHRFPCAKTDDCAAVCLFFKRPRPSLTKSVSEVSQISLSNNRNELVDSRGDDGLDTVLNWKDSDENNNSKNNGRMVRKRRVWDEEIIRE